MNSMSKATVYLPFAVSMKNVYNTIDAAIHYSLTDRRTSVYLINISKAKQSKTKKTLNIFHEIYCTFESLTSTHHYLFVVVHIDIMEKIQVDSVHETRNFQNQRVVKLWTQNKPTSSPSRWICVVFIVGIVISHPHPHPPTLIDIE